MRITSVKVGPMLVPIVYRKLKGVCGEYENKARPTIAIDSRLSKHQTAMAILHESVHCIFEIHWAKKNNEQAVRAIEVGVTGLLVDNPALAEALRKADR